MKRFSAALAAGVLFFFASIGVTSLARAQAGNPLSARAPGSSVIAPASTPVLAQVPGVTAAFPNEGWSSRDVMPTGRWGQAMASYSVGTYPTNNAYVYVISGADPSFANTTLVSRYDVSAATWSNMAPMTPARLQVGAARIGARIYVPGGYGSSFSPTNTLSIYDIATDTWTTGAPLPQATGDYAIGAYADRYLYVIGGYSGSGDLNTVQVYDTTNNTWQLATPKTGTAVAGVRGGIVGNHIVVTGGYSQTLATEIANTVLGTIDPNSPTTIAWSAGTNYPGGTVGRHGAGVPVAAGPAQGASALNFVLFTAGDPNGQGTAVKNDTWLYDFNDNTWKSGPVKLSGVSNIDTLAGVASGGKMYMVSTGGYNGSAVIAANEWLGFGPEAPPDLALTGTDGGLPISRGGTVAYTFNYTVTGPGTASSAQLSDTVPVGTTFNAGASTAGWACTPDANAGSVCTLALGDLVNGNTGSVQFALNSTAPVAPGVTQIVDTAVISSVVAFGPELNLVNNQASVTTQYLPPSILANTGGSPQSATVATAFASMLAVHVTDADGNALAGVMVGFATPGSGASATLSASSVATDINGNASVTATANTIAGTYAASASLTDFGSVTPVSFALANTAGAAVSLALLGGSSQSTVVTTAFATGLTVHATDAFGNPVAGAAVDYSAPASGASAVLSPPGTMTDLDGNASISATANTVAGSYSVNASMAAAAPVSFALTNNAGAPATLGITGGSPQSTAVNTAFAVPLGVHVVDQYGNATPGVAIGFASPTGGASAVLSATSASTDGNGDASIGATANTTAGTYAVTASAAGVMSTTFSLTNTAGAAQALSIIGGSPQSTPIVTAFIVPLSVQVRDIDNNLVAGVDVTFTAPASGAGATLSSSDVITDVNGIAAITAVANDQVGMYTVTASAAGVAAPANFALTNVPADVALSVTIDDHRDYAHYGHTLDYIITLNNAGSSDARHVSIASLLSAQIDVPYAHWLCLSGATSCVASGNGELSDAEVTVPAHDSIAWVLSAPILSDTSDEQVVTAVTASSPDQVAVATATDTTTLVIFRDGLDQPYADGAGRAPLEPLGMSLRGDAGVKVTLPPVVSGQSIETVLDARGPQASGFHLDRLTHSTGTWLRLVTNTGAGKEKMTPWLRLASSSDVVLNLDVSPTRTEVVLVDGTQSTRLDLGNVGGDPSYLLDARAQ